MMLILGRKKNQTIQIGDNIEITVVAIEGDQVKIGIHAPQSIEVHRKEIYLDIQRENNAASVMPKNLLELLSERGTD